ncbi:fusaric acid resistance family protein [Chitinophaga skermanii]|uniref:Fusaric acid resistance family protein n=1 Tax=Chitinophaga skermanii TaxID=331697 RepID=A0A327QT44_9BACT|nr:FUSC family protein [Chitinophaga skermanii]RAJ07015.1 fusaric acid resistance family protein [Chitinophaga skermanii]
MKINKERILRVLIYAAKCVAGALVVFLLSWLIDYDEYIWCLISVMLVLSPDGSDAVALALSRIKANLVGATTGLIMLFIHPTQVVMVISAIAITVILCNVLKLEAATRTALAASIIVMTHEVGTHVYDAAVERVIAVLVGCSLGLMITFAFHNKFIQRTVDDIRHMNEA